LAPFIEIFQMSFCVMNYVHLVYGMQMASAARAWMCRQPQEDWENFLSGFNGFLNQAEADMRNRGVQAMLCPCIDCLNQKKLGQREIIFHHLITRGCRMDLPGPTTSVGTRTDYSVGSWDYSAWATRHLMVWNTRILVEKYSDRKLCMSCTMYRTLRRTRLVLSPQTDL
jgi:hypothetical protein